MSVLKELLALREAEVPMELADIVKFFPNKHGEALQKLWGGKRLVWHGMRFFDEGGMGAAYEKVEEAAKAYIDDGYHAEASLEVNLPDGESADVEWNPKFESDEVQEVYLGYDPKRDTLIIGFDAWTSDEEFNNAFDKTWEDETGDDHDMDEPEHQDAYNAVWKEYNDMNLGFWGLCFEVGPDMEAGELFPPMAGGFYKETYPLLKRQMAHVIDLRLD